MDGLLTEIRFALRHLARSPSFSILVIITLALGIGATTAIFSLVNGVLLRSLPYPESDRLIRIRTHFQGGVGNSNAAANFTDYREQINSVEAITFYRFQRWYLGDTPEPRFPIGAEVSHEFFDVAGIQPALGRGFTAEDERPDTDVVVISHGLWQSHFAGSADVVGRKVMLDGRPHTVIGVTPAGFDLPFREVEVWRPLFFDISSPGHRTDHLYSVIARIADGVTIEEAQAEFAAYGERVVREYPENYKDFQYGVSAVSLLESRVGSVRTPLLVLMGAVIFVLLIAVANVANLLLVRSETRNHELEVRSALGASRLRILRHLFAESLLLSLAGGALGLLLAFLGTRSLLAFAEDSLPRTANVAIDLRVLIVTAVVSIAAGLLAGAFPALRISGFGGGKTLRAGTRSVAAGRSRLRFSLVVAEIAAAVVLVVGAGLMIRSLSELSRVDVGFRTDGILTTRIDLPVSVYGRGPAIAEFYRTLEERVEALPGVLSAGVVRQLPLAGGFGTYSIQIEGLEVDAIGEAPLTYLQLVSPGYFECLGLAATRGRLHDDRDAEGTTLAVTVNEAFVRHHLKDGRAIGRRIKRWGDDQPWAEIIGVIPDIRQRDLERESDPTMYAALAQVAVNGLAEDSFELGFARRLYLVVHTDLEAASFTEPIRNILREIGPAVPVGSFRTMAEIRSETAASREFPTVLLLIFGTIALMLAVVGVYGVVAFAASRRVFEIGIRLALGAEPAQVRRLVVRNGLLPVFVGVGLGLAGAVLATRSMQSLLFNVQPLDPGTLIVASLAIVVAALIASFIPAYRASRVAPSIVLRSE